LVIITSPDVRTASNRGNKIDLVTHDQVEPAVAVITDKRGRGAPAKQFHAGALGHFFEGAVAAIAQEPAAAVLRDVDIDKAVVIKIAHGHAHAVTGDIQARAGADVLEASVRALMIELV